MALSDDLGSPKAGEPTNGGPSAPSNSPQGAAYPTLSSASHRDKPHLRRDPLRVYATRAVVWDALAVLAASAIGFILRWTIPYNLDISDSTYVFFALVVVVSWVSVLVLRGAYDTRILGWAPRSSNESLVRPRWFSAPLRLFPSL